MLSQVTVYTFPQTRVCFSLCLKQKKSAFWFCFTFCVGGGVGYLAKRHEIYNTSTFIIQATKETQISVYFYVLRVIDALLAFTLSRMLIYSKIRDLASIYSKNKGLGGGGIVEESEARMELEKCGPFDTLLRSPFPLVYYY